MTATGGPLDNAASFVAASPPSASFSSPLLTLKGLAAGLVRRMRMSSNVSLREECALMAASLAANLHYVELAS